MSLCRDLQKTAKCKFPEGDRLARGGFGTDGGAKRVCLPVGKREVWRILSGSQGPTLHNNGFPVPLTGAWVQQGRAFVLSSLSPMQRGCWASR